MFALSVRAVIVRIRIADAPIDKVEPRVVAPRHPRRAAAARHDVRVGPGMAPALAASGNGIEAPDALTGVGIIGVEKAARRVLPARDTHDYFVLDHERRECCCIADAVVGELRLPKNAAGPAAG